MLGRSQALRDHLWNSESAQRALVLGKALKMAPHRCEEGQLPTVPGTGSGRGEGLGNGSSVAFSLGRFAFSFLTRAGFPIRASKLFEDLVNDAMRF